MKRDSPAERHPLTDRGGRAAGPPAGSPPARIGPCELRGELARGGAGVVYTIVRGDGDEDLAARVAAAWAEGFALRRRTVGWRAVAPVAWREWLRGATALDRVEVPDDARRDLCALVPETLLPQVFAGGEASLENFVVIVELLEALALDVSAADLTRALRRVFYDDALFEVAVFGQFVVDIGARDPALGARLDRPRRCLPGRPGRPEATLPGRVERRRARRRRARARGARRLRDAGPRRAGRARARSPAPRSPAPRSTAPRSRSGGPLRPAPGPRARRDPSAPGATRPGGRGPGCSPSAATGSRASSRGSASARRGTPIAPTCGGAPWVAAWSRPGPTTRAGRSRSSSTPSCAPRTPSRRRAAVAER